MIALRRDIHQHPELSFQEHRTAALVAEQLRALGCQVRAGVGGTGVVGTLTGTLAGARLGRTVALRADLDALPVEEPEGLPFRSQNPGVMHACGHDLHTACVLGAAMILSACRDRWAGQVKFLFQPAEEKVAGARAMVADGALQDPPVDAVFGFHNQPRLPAGKFGIKAGPLMAGVHTLEMEVIGRGGHGAIPQQAVDPIVAASAVVLGLQTAVSRNTDPLDSAVVTIGSFHAGTADNVIPDRAVLHGTLRAFRPELRRSLPQVLERLARGIAAGYGCDVRFSCTPGVPPVQNDASLAQVVSDAVVDLYGPDALVTASPTMGSEDFSVFQEHVPGCYFWLGSGNRDGSGAPWHSPAFQVDESAIAPGAAVLSLAALRALQSK